MNTRFFCYSSLAGVGSVGVGVGGDGGGDGGGGCVEFVVWWWC